MEVAIFDIVKRKRGEGGGLSLSAKTKIYFLIKHLIKVGLSMDYGLSYIKKIVLLNIFVTI